MTDVSARDVHVVVVTVKDDPDLSRDAGNWLDRN
jgi:hypothetical protein